MDILVCPVCKGRLELKIEVEDAEEVAAGTMYCSNCEDNYPIVNGIPNLVPPELRS